MSVSSKLIKFFVLCFLFSWLIWIFPVLNSYDIITLPLPNIVFILLGAFIPSITGIILTFIEYDIKEVKNLLKKAIQVNFKKSLFLYIFLIPVALFVSFVISKFVLSIDIEAITDPIYIIIALVYVCLLGGPLGEEFGWRGYALPRLFKICKPFYSAIIIGVIWGTWHLPQFFIAGSAQQGINFFGYVAVTVLMSIIITIAYLKTKGSILIAVLIHTFSNVSYGLFPVAYVNDGAIVYAVVLLIVVTFLSFANKKILFSNN